MENRYRGFGLLVVVLYAGGMLAALAAGLSWKIDAARNTVRAQHERDTAIIQAWACVSLALRQHRSNVSVPETIRVFGADGIRCEARPRFAATGTMTMDIRSVYGKSVVFLTATGDPNDTASIVFLY